MDGGGVASDEGLGVLSQLDTVAARSIRKLKRGQQEAEVSVSGSAIDLVVCT